MEEKSLKEILERIKEIPFDKFDIIVAIARGGIIPAGLVSQILDVPVEVLKIRYRDDTHAPIFLEPHIIGDINFSFQGKRVLLIDDVSRSGKTFKVAKAALKEAGTIKTFAVNGEADYSCYNGECFRFPWLIK